MDNVPSIIECERILGARCLYEFAQLVWSVVEPTTRLTDSTEHDYRVTLPNRPPGEVTLAVRVEDEYGNQAVAKTVLNGR